MEKYGNTGRKQRRNRLLTRAVSAFAVLMCASLVPAQTGKELTVYASGTHFAPGDTGTFSVYVPDGVSGDIVPVMPVLPDGVHFVSGRKELKVVSPSASLTPPLAPGRYTLVEFVLLFSSGGTYVFPSAQMSVNGQTVSVSLDLASVPFSETAPRLYWKIPEQPLRAGASSVIGLEGSAVRSIDRADAVPGETFLLERLPQERLPADSQSVFFSVIPLVPGRHVLPSFEAEVTDYTGNVRTVSVAAAEFTAEKAAVSAAPEKTAALPDSFFEKQSVPAGTAENGDLHKAVLSRMDEYIGKKAPRRILLLEQARENWASGETARSLALLRRLEKTSPFPFFYRTLRSDAEKAAGLTDTPAVPSVPASVLLAALCVAAVVCAAVFRGGKIKAVFAAAAVLFFAWFAYSAYPLLWKQAVYDGGAVKIVPEYNASDVVAADSGTPVRVLYGSGDWVSIEFDGEYRGWVLRSDLHAY